MVKDPNLLARLLLYPQQELTGHLECLSHNGIVEISACCYDIRRVFYDDDVSLRHRLSQNVMTHINAID